MLFQGGAGYLSVFHEPELLFRIPPSACCFGLRSRRHVEGVDAQGDKRVDRITRRGRGPVSTFHDQLDRLQPLPRFPIILETNAQQGIAVLFDEPFGPGLTRFEDQPRFHSILREQWRSRKGGGRNVFSILFSLRCPMIVTGASLKSLLRRSSDDGMCTNQRAGVSFFDTRCDASWPLS